MLNRAPTKLEAENRQLQAQLDENTQAKDEARLGTLELLQILEEACSLSVHYMRLKPETFPLDIYPVGKAALGHYRGLDSANNQCT